MNNIKEMREFLNVKSDFNKNEFNLLVNIPEWHEFLVKENLV